MHTPESNRTTTKDPNPWQAKGIRSHVEVDPQEAGLTVKSFIKCEDIRSVAKERLFRRRGQVSPQTLTAVEYRLRVLLGL